jgi:hypothetical protein
LGRDRGRERIRDLGILWVIYLFLFVFMIYDIIGKKLGGSEGEEGRMEIREEGRKGL